jgi:hypothetical protein
VRRGRGGASEPCVLTETRPARSQKTKAPLRTSAGRRRLPGPRENQGWQEVLEGLVQQRQINVAVMTGSADADSGEAPAERWSHLPSADRTAALEHGMEQMLADPMVLRLGGDESPDAGRDILAKIAPELLVTAEGDDALAVPQLLQGAAAAVCGGRRPACSAACPHPALPRLTPRPAAQR